MVVLRLVCTTTACQFVHRSKHGRTDARRARRVSSACLCCDQATRRTSALKISPTESRLLRSGSARLRDCIRTVPTEPLPSFYCEKPNESCRTRIAHASHTHRTRIAHAGTNARGRMGAVQVSRHDDQRRRLCVARCAIFLLANDSVACRRQVHPPTHRPCSE